MNVTDARLEWYDMMDEDQLREWRKYIAKGERCPICNVSGLVDSGRIDPDHGTSSLEQCPMCGPVRTQSPLTDEPAPF